MTKRSTTLAGLAVTLLAAVMLAPPVLAGGRYSSRSRLLTGLHDGFVTFWRTGTPPSGVVDYWFRFHVVKAALAAILLVVLIGFAVQVGRRWAAVAIAPFALFALLAVMANLQGVVAPFSSLLPMLSDGPDDAALTATLTQVRLQLAAERRSPAVDLMSADFGRYHLAMAVIASAVAAGFVVAGVLLWRRAKRLPALLAAAPALAAVTIVVANVGVAENPTPALAAFFNGGW